MTRVVLPMACGVPQQEKPVAIPLRRLFKEEYISCRAYASHVHTKSPFATGEGLLYCIYHRAGHFWRRSLCALAHQAWHAQKIRPPCSLRSHCTRTHCEEPLEPAAVL
jgi:hypothetical protein